MGRPTASIRPPPPQYRDNPDEVSMHTTRGDYEDDDMPELPSYTESEASTAEPRSHPSVQGEQLPVLRPGGVRGWRVLSSNKPVTFNETTIRMDERLNHAENLYAYIIDYLQMVPPKPAVRIYGWHNRTVERNDKKETERVVDFDITLSLQSYLPVATPGAENDGWQPRVASNRDRVHRGSWRRTRARGYNREIEIGNEPEPDLMQWCDDFCQSKAKLKIFRVTRDVPGLDKDFLRKQLQDLIRSTEYRGHLDVSFPIDQKYVDIYSPHIINKWRTSWVRFLFYFSMLWIIAWPILYFTTKRWEVYRVNWCFSWLQDDPREGARKRYASISEQSWYERHANLIMNLALDSYQGDATDLPTYAYSDTTERRGENARMLANTAQGVRSVWNAAQPTIRRDVEGWGADS